MLSEVRLDDTEEPAIDSDAPGVSVVIGPRERGTCDSSECERLQLEPCSRVFQTQGFVHGIQMSDRPEDIRPAVAPEPGCESAVPLRQPGDLRRRNASLRGA